MKLNLGCGNYKMNGFVNVDKFAYCEPEEVVDLAVTNLVRQAADFHCDQVLSIDC